MSYMWQAAPGGAGLLQKLGRVLREKAATDLERITKGASKTREKLGVCSSMMDNSMLIPANGAVSCSVCEVNQVVDELFSYWTLEDSEDTLEQLEELLIVSGLFSIHSLRT